MTEERYHAVQAWFHARPTALRILLAANKLLSTAVYAAYLVSLLVLLLTCTDRLWRALLVPAVVFIGGTVLRAWLNFPRPYEVYHTPALVNKTRSGQSFPSRHLFSASVLTVYAFWLSPPLGWIMALVVLLLAPLRVLLGVHFIRDVIAGIVLGALAGWIGFFML